jgi:hypothetical protein
LARKQTVLCCVFLCIRDLRAELIATRRAAAVVTKKKAAEASLVGILGGEGLSSYVPPSSSSSTTNTTTTTTSVSEDVMGRAAAVAAHVASAIKEVREQAREQKALPFVCGWCCFLLPLHREEYEREQLHQHLLHV